MLEISGSVRYDLSATIDKTSSGHVRITHNKCGKAVVKQPHMTDGDWKKTAEAFAVEHTRCERN